DDTSLAKIGWKADRDDWYNISSGKGVLVLSELRRLMGDDDQFENMMDEFGRTHAGKKVSSAEFAAQAAKAAGRDLSGFFTYWLNSTGLPHLAIDSVDSFVASTSPADEVALAPIRGVLRAMAGPLPENIDITLEYEDGEYTEL